jgi:hypothetical protein
MQTPHHQPRRHLLWLTLILLLAIPGLAFAQQPSAPSMRSLSGHVTDESHEPLRGAIVQLQNSDDNTIVTYLTQADGAYHFKRLNGAIDYRVWASFRGHSSPVHSISKFNSHMNTVINFKIRPY